MMDRTQRVAELVGEASGILLEAVASHLEAWDQADLGTIERQLQGVMRQVSGALLGTLGRRRVAAQAGEQPRCRQCGGKLRLVETARPRFIQGLLGDVQVRRPYYHCAPCRQGYAPLDAAWGLGNGVLSPELTRVACRDGIEGAFALGADLLWEHLGIQVDVEAVRRATEAVGAVAEADQEDRRQWAAPPEQVPTTLLLELDGVLVHARDAWRESKVLRTAAPRRLQSCRIPRQPHACLTPHRCQPHRSQHPVPANPGKRARITGAVSPAFSAAPLRSSFHHNFQVRPLWMGVPGNCGR